MADGWADRLADKLVGHRWLLLALGVALATLVVFAAGPPPFDRAVENMFAADDPVRQSYQRLVQRFQANELVLAVYEDQQLLDPGGAGLQRLQQISQRLQAVDGVRDVLSLAQLNASLSSLTMPSFFNAADQPPALLRDEPLSNSLLQLFQGLTHGADGRTVSIACLLETRATPDADREPTISALREVMLSLPPPLANGVLAGEPVLVADGFRYVAQDGRQLGRVAAVLIALALAVLFRSLRWMVIPLAVVQLTVWLAEAAIYWSGARLTLVSSTLAAMLTVIGVAAVVHLVVGIRRRVAEGQPPEAAVRQTLANLAAPLMWSAATDAVAFLSLTASSVGPVRDYGVTMALGAALVPLSVALLVPGAALLGHRARPPRKVWGDGQLRRGLSATAKLAIARPRGVVLVVFCLALAGATGLPQLRVQTDFTRNFRNDSPLVRSYELIEGQLGGAGVWDVMVPAPAALTPEFVARIDQLQQRLRDIRSGGRPGLTKVISLIDSVQAAGNSPLLRLAGPELRARALQAGMPKFFATLRAVDTSGQSWLRIMLRSLERQPAEQKRQLIEAVRRQVAEAFPAAAQPAAAQPAIDQPAAGQPAAGQPPTEQPTAEVAGFYVLLTELIRSAMRDQWVCFGLSLAGIGVSLALALRSLRLAAIGLLVNALPVLTLLGLIGWLGVAVNLGVAMIAAVAMGLSVDSSLHYLIAYRRGRQAGATTEQAVQQVEQQVGRAVVFSTLALVIGFLSLTTSQFVPTVTFGALSALAMLGGLVGNLLLMPALLLCTGSKRC